MLEAIFSQLQLKDTHTRVYLHLLESGPRPAGDLAKRLQIPRATLYGILDELCGCELVAQSQKNGVKIWHAASPEKIQQRLHEQIDTLQKTSLRMEDLLSDLKQKQKIDFVPPKFTYYEGIDGIRQVLKDPLVYRDIETEAFWPFSDMVDILGEDFMYEYGIEKREKRNISIRVLWPEGRMPDKQQHERFLRPVPHRQIRIAPALIDSSMGYWTYENKVACISSRKESFAFIVESTEFRQLMKTQFDALWAGSRVF